MTRTVYTASARQGIWRYVQGRQNIPAGAANAVVDASGNLLSGLTATTYNVPLNDPLALGLNPTILAIINRTPLPNNFTVGDGLNTAGFTTTVPANQEKQYDFVTKVDHTFNEKNSIYVRYAQGEQNTLSDTANDGTPRFPGFPNWVDTFRTPKNLAINYRWSPTSTITNELVTGLNRFGFSFNNPDPNANTNPPFTFTNITDSINFTPPINNLRRLTTYQLADNLSLTRGSHTYKGGINFRYQKHDDIRSSVAALNTNLAVDFSRTTNPPDATAHRITAAQLPGLNATDRNRLLSMINELLGRVGSLSQAFVAASDSAFAPPGTPFLYDARYPEYDFYFQDTWKFRPNLTFDMGLRWEVKISPKGGGNNIILRPDRPIRLGEAPSDSIKFVEGQLFDSDWNNFAPTLGFAWDPFKSGKTSIRGNFRLAYDRMNTFIVSSQILPNMPGTSTGVVNTSFGTSGGRAGNLPTLAPAGSPLLLRQPPPFSTNSLTVFDPSTRSPKTYQWGFSAQREIGFKSVLEVNYIGRKGIGLYGAYDVNQVDIFNNGFLSAFNTVRAGGESSLVNSLLSADARRIAAGVTGSVFLRNTLAAAAVTQGSVAAAANAIAISRNSGAAVPVIVQSGFSPFFFRKYPQFSGALRVLDTNDYSTYHALEAQLKRRFNNWLGFQVSYTLAKSMDTRSFDPTFSVVSTGSAQSASSTPFDNRNRRLNFARSDFDRRHTFQGYMVTELPLGRGHRYLHDLHPVVDRIIGGWELGSVMIFASGRPFTVYSGLNTVSNVNQSPANCNSCNATMGNLVVENGRTFWFNASQRAQFSQPGPGELGNTGRNFFNTPTLFDVDLTLGKRFRLTEAMNIEIRAE
ncbi:MAG: TonB-dependent receptor, partial [bacterium]